MTDRLIKFPSDDAPIEEWLRPLSAKAQSSRADLNVGSGYAINKAALKRRIDDVRAVYRKKKAQ